LRADSRETPHRKGEAMSPNHLDPLFNPRAIAVFGASESGRTVGSLVFRNILAGGFEGRVIAINPKYEQVGGRPCHPSIAAAGADIDLAVIATPAATVPGILRECGEAGVRHAIVLSAGFGETGTEGRALEAQMRDAARTAGVRFMGPNCVGLVRPWLKLDATFLQSSPPPGRLALVSQSGALCSAIADWAEPHNLGFSALISLGNSTDLGFGDVVNFLAGDPNTDAILLYVEGVRDARAFVSALRMAVRVKPVIVLKAGRHEGGSKAASTHTGALIGSDAVFNAALERAGAVRAQSFGQLFAAAAILSANREVAGRRLAVITNGGGAGVLAADRAGDLHVELAQPSPATIGSLDAILPAYWSRANPLDILGDAGAGAFAAATRAALADPAFDGVLVALTPQAMTDPAAVAEAVLEEARQHPAKPLLACWMGETAVAKARKLLGANGVPAFNTPEEAVEAFSYLARHALNRKLALEAPGPLAEVAEPDIEGALMIIEAALAEGRDMLSSAEAKAVLRAFHIPVNVTMEAENAGKALLAAETIGFPVAMKINSPHITHKSDVGGVRTNISSAGEVRPAFTAMIERARTARPDADIRGVTIEAMARVDDARELLVGAHRDPAFGPAILFGAGGAMVEIMGDSATALPPLNRVLADRTINRTRIARLLGAFRDRPPVDREAVADVLIRVSDLVCELPHVEELDINPLIAGPSGVVAVDARIRLRRPPADQGAYGHLAILPYPRRLARQGFLADGTEITIRPIRPEDAESERAFVRNLSPEARKFRFMHALAELTPEMLARFTQIDYHREMALIATTREGTRDEQQGVARYVINPDETSCEFAIVVSDRRQRQGIGTRLMHALMDAARDHGLRRMQGAVLAENHSMLQLMTDLGFSRRPDDDDPSLIQVERDL